MQIESSVLAGDILQLKLNGRLDLHGTQAITDKFSFATTARKAKIVVDLAEVSFLSSIGIRLLLTSARAQAQRGGTLILAAPQPCVRGIIEAAGIDKLIVLVADVDAARAKLAD